MTSSPDMPGSRMSQTITSGLCRRAISTPSAPLAASLTTKARVAQQIAEEVARHLVVVDHQQAPRLHRYAVGGQLGQQPFAIHRLAREGVGAQRPRLLGIVDPGDHQHGDIAGSPRRRLSSARKLQVSSPCSTTSRTIDAGPQRLEDLARLRGAARRHQLEQRAAQQLLVDVNHLRVVLDDQHGQPRAGPAPTGSARASSRRGCHRFGRVVDARPPRRRRSSRRRARSRADTRPPSSSASLRDSGRPRPVPLHPPLQRVLDLRELLEDPLLVLGARCRCRCRRTENTTRVAVVRRRAAHPDLAPLGELQRVGDEVAQDLRDLALVGVQRRQVRAAPRTPGSPTRSTSSGRSMPRSAPNRFSTSNSAGRTTDLARLDLGQVEQVVDQLGEVLRPPCG